MALIEWSHSWAAAAPAWLPRDERVLQILFLAALLTTGVVLRDFSVQPLQVALTFAAGLATQAWWLDRLGLKQRGFFSAIVTCGAAAWQYALFRPNALIWALFLLTPLVPLLDRMFPAQRFEWRGETMSEAPRGGVLERLRGV